MSADLSQAKFISPVRQFCEKDESSMVIQSKRPKKSMYFLPAHVYVSIAGSGYVHTVPDSETERRRKCTG